jgi:hypothetical protein
MREENEEARRYYRKEAHEQGWSVQELENKDISATSLILQPIEIGKVILFDLKTGKLTHQDIGQADMYVRLFDDLKRGHDDNPTVVIILCTDKDDTIVKYSVLHDSEHLYASKYLRILPSELELKRELESATCKESLPIQPEGKHQINHKWEAILFVGCQVSYSEIPNSSERGAALFPGML